MIPSLFGKASVSVALPFAGVYRLALLATGMAPPWVWDWLWKLSLLNLHVPVCKYISTCSCMHVFVITLILKPHGNMLCSYVILSVGIVVAYNHSWGRCKGPLYCKHVDHSWPHWWSYLHTANPNTMTSEFANVTYLDCIVLAQSHYVLQCKLVCQICCDLVSSKCPLAIVHVRVHVCVCLLIIFPFACVCV